MNQSDDDIFGRNIDQLDRETPRYNLSEEEEETVEESEENDANPRTPPKKKSIDKKPPSIASVPPYTQTKIIPVMSPHPIKKGMGSTDEATNHQMSVGQYYKSRYPMNTPAVYTSTMQNIKNFQANPLSKPHIESNPPLQPPSTQVPPSSQQMHPAMVNMSRQGLEHITIANMKRPSVDHHSPPMRPHTMPLQIHGDKPPAQHIQTPFMNQLLNNQPRVHAPPLQDQRIPCYCQDCIHSIPQPGMSQQMVINSERQRIEDEILLRQRELDSCWQEDEIDFPRDFTAIDRKKENFYAQRNDSGNYSRSSNDPVNQEKDILKGRETKTSAVPTSAFPTSVPRSLHQTPNGASYGPIMKTKAKAVVSPFPRAVPQKKVNINNIVSQFSYSNDPDTPQDYTANGWPQSEMGSRIPSSERISLSPLCMSGVPSGVQTPNDPDSNQKPLHQQQISVVADVPSSVPSGMPLQQLPGNDKKKLSVLEKFKGSEQYQRAHLLPATHGADSVKDFTTARWPNSEMGSRIPSSERISLSPLTMSAVPSGIQTPVEPSSACVELRGDNQGNTTSKPVEKKTSIPIIPEGHHVETPDPPPEQDAMQDYSQFPQSELSSRIPSCERICLSPLCQSGVPSGRQSPVQREEDQPADNIVVTLRPKKKNINNDKLNDIVARMNIGDGNVPRFNYVEEYSAQNYARPEETSRMQSYENLVFTPSWSANTSGLVTPCDHSSLHGGAKPLRQIPVVEEDPEGPVHTAPKNELHKQMIDDTQHAKMEGRKEETGRYKSYTPRCSVENKPPVPLVASMATSHHENDQLARETYSNAVELSSSSDMYNNSAEEGRPNHLQPLLKQHHPIQNPNLRRRSSWSSGASTGSNRTDISTVVNASTSMHNTAPGSPDPDRSEDSDSDTSDHVIDDNAKDFPSSFSRNGSPSPSKPAQNVVFSRNQNMPLPAPQRRWAPQNAVQGPRLAQRHIGLPGRPENDLSDLKPGSKETKNFIQMAKEWFPKQSVTQPSEFSHPEHMRITPHNAHHMIPPTHQPPFNQFGYRFQDTQHIDHQPRYGNYRPNYDYDGAGGARGHPQAYYNYQHRPMRPTHEMQRYHDPQPHYHANNIHHRMLAPHPAHPPPRMHPIPERDSVPPVLHNPQRAGLPSDMHSDIHEADVYHGGQAHPAQFQRQMTNTMSADPTHVHGYYDSAIHDPARLQTPYQSQQPLPSHQQQTTTTQSGPNAVYNQRAFSVTSLEPNRASPPPNESLDTASVVSFASMAASNQNLDAKTDMMSSLLSMLGTHDADDMSRTLLAMSNGADNVSAMRQSGCVPLLIQLMHSEDYEMKRINWAVRQRAGLALHNIVHSNSGDRRGKREVRVLRLLEIIRLHSEAILAENDENYRLNRSAPPLREHGPGPAVAAVMKLSFQEDHKNTICELGGLQAVGEILAVDYMANKDCHDPYAIALRKYAGMVLINLTYNDAKNKAVLCSMTSTLKAIIGQLQLTDEEDLVQVFAGIIRNISWRPDDSTQKALKNINTVRALMLCIQKLRTEVCIRAVLSAIWNLSAHNSENKEEICRTPGSLQFLAFALSYRSPSRSIIVAENAGGILRNISSHIAVSGEYRKILRQEGCLQTLVSQLRSPSTRVVSNSCGVLWNLSARCVEDQELLWDLGAVSVLKTLIHSKHKSISASSAAALRNLLAVKPGSGTDTESHISFQHHRSNSLPTRTRHNRQEKKGKSPVASRKQRHNDAKVDGPVETNMVYFDHYVDLSARPVAEHTIPSVSEECPPTYNEATSEEPTRRVYADDGRQHSFENIQHQNDRYFFPVESSRLPISTRIHKRFDSSSSCSSFSPNENKTSKLPYVSVKAMVNETSEPKSEMEEKFAKLDIKPNEENEENKTTSLERKTKEEKIPKEEKKVSRDEKRNQVEMKPYEDSKLSIVKDAVLIYVGTPKLPTKPKKEKKQKQVTPKLSTKFKRNSHKKSKDSLCSKDSLSDKPEIEKNNDREKPRGGGSDDKKENIWIKTKEFKQKLLNKSHSSDLAFDKNLMYASTKKSPFDIYSMSNFPDRVASDQCLTMSDRRYRDVMPAFHHAHHHHHGSFSSCESHINDEKIFSPNQHVGGNVTQQREMNFGNNGNQTMVQPFYSPQIGHEYHNAQRNFFQPNRAYHSNQNMYSTTVQGAMSGDSHIEFASENEKKTKTKKSLLKNPLRKSSDSKFSLKGKKSEKKVKKKSEDKD